MTRWSRPLTKRSISANSTQAPPRETRYTRKRWITPVVRLQRIQAIQNPGDTEGHFQLARAIGRNALTMGTRDRIKFAGEVRAHALEALKINPKHAGALHVMGEWNAEVMRLNGVSRMIAKNFLGGQIFGEASWDNAQRYLEEAVANDPNRITHHLDLGRVYVDRKQKDKAREQFTLIDKAAATEYNDRSYKEKAQRLMKELD
jgi:hypothetical protein